MPETYLPGRAKQGLPYRQDGGGDPLAYLMLPRGGRFGSKLIAGLAGKTRKKRRKAKS